MPAWDLGLNHTPEFTLELIERRALFESKGKQQCLSKHLAKNRALTPKAKNSMPICAHPTHAAMPISKPPTVGQLPEAAALLEPLQPV
jgi:hypothetical protein